MIETKEFKTETKKLLDMMIHSIYTHKEIFLRELISNASDAIDKRKFLALTDHNIPNVDYEILVEADKAKRTLTITDNGIGMSKEELEENLGTIAKSGSKEFLEKLGDAANTSDIIGQFGVGFYSAFMVANKVEVLSHKVGSEESYLFSSEGLENYTISSSDELIDGTRITLYLRDDTEEEKYSDFLDEYTIKELIRKYSDYVRYPIKTWVTKYDKPEEGKEDKESTHLELETINSMIPLWKKNRKDVTDEELNNFYKQKFTDYQDPLASIFVSVEGMLTYNALLFIPRKPLFNMYNDRDERGLQLYTKGVFILDKCKDLIPDYLYFVKGLVDSADLPLNISRELLQEDRQIKKIATNVEKKVLQELAKILKNEPEKYQEICENISKFLKGNNKEVVNELKEKISIASDNLEFEKAKEYKTMLDSILTISEKQYMELKDKIDRDFVSFNLRDNYIGIVVLIMRKGMIIFKRSFVYELMGEVNDFVVDILTQYYLKNTLPKEIIVPTEELKELLSSYFSEVNIIAPTRGQLFEILQTTKENAKEALEQHFMTARLEDDNIKILEHLGEILKIKTPYRIELFDNSHLMGTNAVGAMVCFINGEPVKKMFRKFNLDNKNTKDDLESMKEVIFRRYSRLKQENQSYPDLIIVDGGYNQLVAAKEILKSIDVDINLAGLVKNDKHQTSALMDEDGNEYEINDDKPLFYLLTRMQDEVHRFAISSHINKRKKSMFKSIFDEIEGIGAKRKELLLKNYPTLQELKSARIEELEQIIPKKVAIELKEKLENLK